MIIGLNAIILDIVEAKRLQSVIRLHGWTREIIKGLQRIEALDTVTKLDDAIKEIESREIYREEI